MTAASNARILKGFLLSFLRYRHGVVRRPTVKIYDGAKRIVRRILATVGSAGAQRSNFANR